MSLPDKLSEFNPGDIAYYRESGYIHKVEIIKVLSNEEWEGYRLRVIEIIYPKDCQSPLDEVFNCRKQRGIYCKGLWDISKPF